MKEWKLKVDRWPSLENDFGSINNLFSPIFTGFYYKTFMGPHRNFGKIVNHLLEEPWIR